jgi:hypothetical protein
MEFTLHYSGDLKTNADRVQKHKIRKAFHIQMKEMWNHEPLRDRKDLIEKHKSSIGNFNFVPLITEKMGMTVEINIVMLRFGKPGKIVIEGGDIDNRLKTLFDSLRTPDNEEGLPNEASPGEGEDPFYCLLSDDNLITGVTVHTDRLLNPLAGQAHVEMYIKVITKRIVDYIATSGF